jgi:hypothetical protein
MDMAPNAAFEDDDDYYFSGEISAYEVDDFSMGA